MSNAKTPAKVLRVAFRRIQRGWVQSAWSNLNKQTGVTEVCIEGAIYGFTMRNDKNPACKMACDLILEVIKEKHQPMLFGRPVGQFSSIPHFNDDPNTTQAMVEDVVKTALIRAETGGLLRDTEEECWE
jgi:hypothetical protein